MCLRPAQAHVSGESLLGEGQSKADFQKNYVYLDYAASAPLCQEAIDAMSAYLVSGSKTAWYAANPNSLHSPGREAFAALEGYREDIASLVGAARPDEIIFTSGATESDNAIIGIAKAAYASRVQAMQGSFRPNVITSSIEHDAIKNAVASLEKDGFDVVYVQPTHDGFITPEALAAAADSNTVLVTVQMVNAEIGSVQPIAELARVAHEVGALMHTDATQAIGKLEFDAQALGVDSASWTAHKLGGPKGVGALYLKARTPYEAQALGGGQEGGKRSGTQNVMGVAGLHAAMNVSLAIREQEEERLMKLRDSIYECVQEIDGVRPTIPVEKGDTRYVAGIVNLITPGVSSEFSVLKMDALGFAVSGGSACASHSLEPSHVLTALGIPKDDALCELRVSFGRYTRPYEIDRFIDALKSVVYSN